MSHLEYVTALVDKLNELDGKSVTTGDDVTRRVYNGRRMDPEYVAQLDAELSQLHRAQNAVNT